MLEQNQIISAINKVLEEKKIKLKVRTEQLQTPLKDLGIDSLKAMVIITELEQTFNILLPDEKLLGLKTVGDLVELIMITSQK